MGIKLLNSLCAHHSAYDGGSAVWRMWNARTFANEVLAAADFMWHRRQADKEAVGVNDVEVGGASVLQASGTPMKTTSNATGISTQLPLPTSDPDDIGRVRMRCFLTGGTYEVKD